MGSSQNSTAALMLERFKTIGNKRTGPKDTCHNPGIRDKTTKQLVTEALGLEEYDEATMDAQMEKATILDHTVTFHFRDGHTESRDFLDKRRGTPWTPERRVAAYARVSTDNEEQLTSYEAQVDYCTWGQRKRFADGKVTVPFTAKRTSG